MSSIFRRIFGDTDRQGTWVTVDSALTADILGYAGRKTDRTQIRDTIVRRYGTGIRMEKDPETGVDYVQYEKAGFRARMNAGHIETNTIGLGHKIAGAIATLFSEPTQNFDLVGPDGVDVSDADDLLNETRKEGGFTGTLVEADMNSIWVGSIPVFIEFVDGGLEYHAIDPGKIQVLFEEAISSNGKNRPTNKTQIEDSTLVIISTGTTEDMDNTYVAIFGRSTKYPNGRYVQFVSSGDGQTVPEVGADGAFDWVENGEIGNPLSVYANEHPDEDLPEYPIATIHSCLISKDHLFPVSSSLHVEALEADVAASHVRATSSDNAKGTRYWRKSEDGSVQKPPKSLHGEIILEAGQEVKNVDADSGAPKIAWEILQEEMVATGQGFTVPDFYVSSRDHTVEAASGVALKVRSGQLTKLRGRRIETNEAAVDKIFKIEKAYISMMSDADQSTIDLLEQCDQNWDPGIHEIPQEDEKMILAVKELVSLGVYDTIEAIRVVYGLSSESEAIDKYEQLAERAQKYPPLGQTIQEEIPGLEEEE